MASEPLWQRDVEWPDFGTAKADWLESCLGVLNSAIASASHFLPVGTVIVSSYAPSIVCEELAAAISTANAYIEARPGELGISPKALGAASLPFSSKFTVELK